MSGRSRLNDADDLEALGEELLAVEEQGGGGGEEQGAACIALRLAASFGRSNPLSHLRPCQTDV